MVRGIIGLGSGLGRRDKRKLLMLMLFSNAIVVLMCTILYFDLHCSQNSEAVDVVD
jgi:hypothetical protein